VSEKFYVGELATVRRDCVAEFCLERYKGEDVTVVAVIGAHEEYHVVHADGMVFVALHHVLIKRRLLREDLAPARWEDCAWRPSREVAT
jgi:hypothetical protein